MVPIPGFQIANWVHSSLFGNAGRILKASIVSEKAELEETHQEDVTGLLQRYAHFCHERIGRKVLFLPGLSALSEFKSAAKKVSAPKLLLVHFETSSGNRSSQALFVDPKGNIVDTPGEEKLNAEEKIFR